MSLLSETPITNTIHGLPCSVAVTLDKLATVDPDSCTDLVEWLKGNNPDLGTDSDVHARLQAIGYRVGRQTIGRHRRYEQGRAGDVCRCAA